mgnify:CR=1 FL=1
MRKQWLIIYVGSIFVCLFQLNVGDNFDLRLLRDETAIVFNSGK